VADSRTRRADLSAKNYAASVSSQKHTGFYGISFARLLVRIAVIEEEDFRKMRENSPDRKIKNWFWPRFVPKVAPNAGSPVQLAFSPSPFRSREPQGFFT
jgi:hypothetical protein